MRGKTWRLTPKGDLVVALTIFMVGILMALVFWDNDSISTGFAATGIIVSLAYMSRAERKRLEQTIESLRMQSEWDSITIDKLRGTLAATRDLDG